MVGKSTKKVFPPRCAIKAARAPRAILTNPRMSCLTMRGASFSVIGTIIDATCVAMGCPLVLPTATTRLSNITETAWPSGEIVEDILSVFSNRTPVNPVTGTPFSLRFS